MADVRAVRQRPARRTSASALDDYRRAARGAVAPLHAGRGGEPRGVVPDRAQSAAEIITPTPDEPASSATRTRSTWSRSWTSTWRRPCSSRREAAADALGVPRRPAGVPARLVYATDPVYVAEHPDLWRVAGDAASPRPTALGVAGVGDRRRRAPRPLLVLRLVGELHAGRARASRPDDARPLTVTGGLPYHGGAGSDYLTHSIATDGARPARRPGLVGLVTGVGMHMTKHVARRVLHEPGHRARAAEPVARSPATVPIVDRTDGPATVAAYTVVHGRDGAPEWGVAVCDLPDGARRCYARIEDRRSARGRR